MKMNQKQTILIDLDDTLNDLLNSWLSLYNSKYNDNISCNDITSWDITKFVKPEAVEDIYELLKTPNLFSELVQPKPGSVEATQILSKYYDLYIVTSCAYPNTIIEKFEWVEKHYPHINQDNIITAKNKGLIIGDYIIDDYENNLIASKCNTKLLFTTPRNTFCEIENDIIRVSSWNEILWFFAKENEELANDVIENTIEKTFDENEDEKVEEEMVLESKKIWSFFREQGAKLMMNKFENYKK